MIKTIGIRFRKGMKIYDFDPGAEEFIKGDIAIVETAEGIEAGEVVYIDKEIKDKKEISALKTVLRKANKKDWNKILDFKKKQKEVLEIFGKKIAFHDLPMKPIDVYFSFDNKKIIFFFTSESRVDFRNLVKDLARKFKKQIILRQIGPRDVAKIQGGYGICGEQLCCNMFLQDLGNVVMDMVRDQDLGFRGSEKLSGVCGRLKCCLVYEEDNYKKLKSKMPDIDTEVEINSEHGIIVGRNTLKQEVEVEFKNKTKIIVPIKEVKIIKKK